MSCSNQAAGRKPGQPLVIATLVFLLSAAISAGLLWRAEGTWQVAEREQASRLAQSHSQVLQRNIERLLSNNYALAAMVRQGNGHIANFDSAAGQLLLTDPRLLALSISPGGVVQDVVPRKGNEKLIGFDQFNDPAQMKEAIFTRDTGRLTLAGPI